MHSESDRKDNGENTVLVDGYDYPRLNPWTSYGPSKQRDRHST